MSKFMFILVRIERMIEYLFIYFERHELFAFLSDVLKQSPGTNGLGLALLLVTVLVAADLIRHWLRSPSIALGEEIPASPKKEPAAKKAQSHHQKAICGPAGAKVDQLHRTAEKKTESPWPDESKPRAVEQEAATPKGRPKKEKSEGSAASKPASLLGKTIRCDSIPDHLL